MPPRYFFAAMITIYVIAVIFMATVFVMLGRYTIGRIRCYRRSRHLANQRMQLLRRLLQLAYVYSPNPALFLKKFREEVSIGHLECCDVICNYAEQRQLDAMKSCKRPLKSQDVLLCILLNKGFTPQELSVIYGMSNCNSIYVRCSRIRKQCREIMIDKDAAPVKQPVEQIAVATEIEF